MKNSIKSGLIALFIVSAFVLGAQAADSTWLLCDNGVIAVSSVEHRAGDGFNRMTSLSLILGGNIFGGELRGADAGKVSLSGKNNDGFTGTVSIDYSTNRLMLKGILNMSNSAFNIDSELQCKEMNAQQL